MSNLNNVKVKATPIELGGETYHLKYDLNAFAELEEEYGSLNRALNSLGGEKEKDSDGKVIMIEELDDDGNVVLDSNKAPKMVPQRKISIKGIRSIFWAGLLHEHPKMTQREAGALLDISNMKYLAEKLTEAMKASMPKIKDEAAKEDASKKTEDIISGGVPLKNVVNQVSN